MPKNDRNENNHVSVNLEANIRPNVFHEYVEKWKLKNVQTINYNLGS